jgi:hypothetical protein
VEKVGVSVDEVGCSVDDTPGVESFWISLSVRGCAGGWRACRNLSRLPAREGGIGRKPRIHTVRRLTASAGDEVDGIQRIVCEDADVTHFVQLVGPLKLLL